MGLVGIKGAAVNSLLPQTGKVTSQVPAGRHVTPPSEQQSQVLKDVAAEPEAKALCVDCDVCVCDTILRAVPSPGCATR